MDSLKRGRTEAGLSSNGGVKKWKQELDSLSSVGSKSRPCTKFFSTAGCPFGEGCHFLHYVPGGYNAIAHIINTGPPGPVMGSRNVSATVPLPTSNGPLRAMKSKMCNKYNSAEGCKFGEKCHFAHGEWELGKPISAAVEDMRPRMGGRMEPAPPGTGGGPSFGASCTSKISVDASLAGAIIGKGGANSKQICRQTGARLSIRDHESDPNLRNIELDGTFEQIRLAGSMVEELIGNVRSTVPKIPIVPPATHGPTANNYKTKLCENFAKGTCTFGERCHFAHGTNEMRNFAI